MLWPLLHAGQGPTGPFLTAWNLTPGLWLSLLVAAGAYLLGWRWLRGAERSGSPGWPGWRLAAFLGGIASLAVALAGPLDTFNDDLFLIHMLQHVLLMLVAAPLLVLGRPVQLALRAVPPRYSGPVLRVLRPGPVRGLLSVLTNPILVFVLFNLTLVGWHLPGLYTLALENELAHEIEHATFLGTALLFWWIIIAPVPRHHRVAPHWAIVLLFASGSIGDLLGMTLALSQRVLYPIYVRDTLTWGISPLLDQRLSGVIMLASGSVVFFGAVFVILSREANSPTYAVASAPGPRPAGDAPRSPAEEFALTAEN